MDVRLDLTPQTQPTNQPTNQTTKMKYLVQYELDGQWITIARRTSFRAACAKARSEGRAMKWAHHTSVIQDGDPEILRLCAENAFQLRPDPNRRPNQPNHNEKTA